MIPVCFVAGEGCRKSALTAMPVGGFKAEILEGLLLHAVRLWLRSNFTQNLFHLKGELFRRVGFSKELKTFVQYAMMGDDVLRVTRGV